MATTVPLLVMDSTALLRAMEPIVLEFQMETQVLAAVMEPNALLRAQVSGAASALQTQLVVRVSA